MYLYAEKKVKHNHLHSNLKHNHQIFNDEEKRKEERERYRLTDVLNGLIIEMPYGFVGYKVSLAFNMLNQNCHQRPIW